jgi:predicted ATPase
MFINNSTGPPEAGQKEEGMKKVNLTGGPHSGKTTTMLALREEFGDQITLVPEVATILLEGGFPVPGKDLDWSEEWQAAFQAAILPLQRSIEEACALVARKNGSRLLVCDRGLLDGAAYTPGGVAEFCRRYGVEAGEALARYEAVIHLESLATADPAKYGKAGNDSRFEPLERAQALEAATRESWADHPHHAILDGKRGIVAVISEVIGIVRFLLSRKEG